MTIPQLLETQWETAQQFLGRRWLRRGSLRLHDQVRATLGAQLEVSGPFDLELSKRLVAKTAPGLCYWNAARAVLVERELSGAAYVEGLVCHHWAFNHEIRCPATAPAIFRLNTVNVNWQGWLEVDGRVVDPTSLLSFEFQPVRAETVRSILERSLYLPLVRYGRTELGDRWEELPLTLSDQAAFDATVAATDSVFGAYADALLSARRFQPGAGRFLASDANPDDLAVVASPASAS